MAEIANYRVGNEKGCGFMGGFFQKWNHWPKKSHVHSLPSSVTKTEPLNNNKPSKNDISVKPHQKSDQNPSRNNNNIRKVNGKRLSDTARTSASSSSNGSAEQKQSEEGKNLARVKTGPAKSRASMSTTTSNSPGSASRAALLALSRKSLDEGAGNNSVMGNIVRRNSCGDEFRGFHSGRFVEEPEALKKMGNEAYKQGRFKEALTLYDKAIALDLNKAAYRSNKAAALIGLDRLVEAVSECREAIRIEPSYQRAHHRLATLYLRLGEAEKALHHYKISGSNANSEDLEKAQALKNSLVVCNEAKKLQKWSVLLTETQFAISSGANSAPLIFALQAEALLKLMRHEEAYKAYQNGPNLSIDVCTNFFGMSSCAYFLMIGSHVYLAVGRFEESEVAAQQAEKLDPSNKEASAAVKRAKAISSARTNGNLLFKAEKFSQACVIYGHGLEHDPHNSVLLCNRAACLSKLGKFEKAIQDCTAALRLQPSYTKARLRRADCNAKLERWESSVLDYEVLIREAPGDEEVGKALFEARLNLKRQRGEIIEDDTKLGSNFVSISSNESFRHIVTSPGMSVVLFCYKDKQKRVFQALEQVCKRFPSVNFLKVEVEDHPYLVKTEGISIVPTYKIYKNGSIVKEIPGSNHELLENSVKWYSA